MLIFMDNYIRILTGRRGGYWTDGEADRWWGIRDCRGMRWSERRTRVNPPSWSCCWEDQLLPLSDPHLSCRGGRGRRTRRPLVWTRLSSLFLLWRKWDCSLENAGYLKALPDIFLCFSSCHLQCGDFFFFFVYRNNSLFALLISISFKNTICLDDGQ